MKAQKGNILINDLKSQDGVPVCVNSLRCDKKTEMKCIDQLCKKPAEEYLLIMVQKKPERIKELRGDKVGSVGVLERSRKERTLCIKARKWPTIYFKKMAHNIFHFKIPNFEQNNKISPFALLPNSKKSP